MKRVWKAVSVCMVMVLLAQSIFVSAEAKTQTGYQFTYKKVTVSMHDKAKKLIKKAGKPEKTKVKKSCAYKGKDRTYQYKSFILYTYSNSDKGEEYVNGVTFLDDSIATPEGIKIGSSLSEVTKAYGKGQEKFGVYTYEKGKSRLQIEVENDKVKNLRYVALTES